MCSRVTGPICSLRSSFGKQAEPVAPTAIAASEATSFHTLTTPLSHAPQTALNNCTPFGILRTTIGTLPAQ
jgi:hypothetical protein